MKAPPLHSFISRNGRIGIWVKWDGLVYGALPVFVTNCSSHHEATFLSLSNHDTTVNLCACKEKARKFLICYFNTTSKDYSLTVTTSSIMLAQKKKRKKENIVSTQWIWGFDRLRRIHQLDPLQRWIHSPHFCLPHLRSLHRVAVTQSVYKIHPSEDVGAEHSVWDGLRSISCFSFSFFMHHMHHSCHLAAMTRQLNDFFLFFLFFGQKALSGFIMIINMLNSDITTITASLKQQRE